MNTQNNQKITLIAPPSVRIKGNISGVYPLPPLGLAYIAAVLEKGGFLVEIIDMPALKVGLQDAKEYFRKNSSMVYGISCNLFNLSNGIEISRIIKELHPQSKVVVGGRCNALPPETIFKYGSDFDILVRGEGEKAMLNICNMLKNNEYNLHALEGISFFNNGKVINNKNSPFINLDELPYPARHLLLNKYYRLHPPFGAYPPATIVETSRGCKYNCVFCGLSQPVRERSVGHIIEEIKEVINKFRIKEIHFVDPNFTYNPKRIMELCNQLMRNKIRIAWTCKTRVDLVSKTLLESMSKAGCYMISYGVESGSQIILDILNKDITIENTIEAFAWTKNTKIRTLAYVLLGSPNESENTIKETISLVKKIAPDFVLYGKLLPDPNSILLKQSLGKGGIDLNYEDIASFYINKKSILNEKIIPGVVGNTKIDIDRWKAYANKSFYLRPGYILLRLWETKNFQDLFNLIQGAYFLIAEKFKRKDLVK